MKVQYLRAAQQELRDAIRYYDDQVSGLGKEFLSEVRAALTRIKSMPFAWPSIDDNVRRCQTRRFPYGLIYKIQGKSILIIAVAHLHREPNYWRDRL